MVTGRLDEVSYVLLKNNVRYHFKGVPDYVVNKDAAGADAIIVACGEVQSTNQADVQNAIYGVGFLLREFEENQKHILCITIFKNKTATLSVARLSAPQPNVQREVIAGEVSLKYVVSPSPLILQSKEGMKDFCTRLFYLLV